MRLRAHAKINLALRVGRRGSDGYHPVATVLQTVSLADRLVVASSSWDRESSDAAMPVPKSSSKSQDTEVSGRELPIRLSVVGGSLPADNTVTRAVRLLVRFLRDVGNENLPPLSITLRKRIPSGAGLGGGSSDAAAALTACWRLWYPQTARDSASHVLERPAQAPPGSGEQQRPAGAVLAELAAQVGADVPFFLLGGTALGVGRGDRVEPLPPLQPQWLVIAAAGQQVSTAAAYAAFDEAHEGTRAADPGSGSVDSAGDAEEPAVPDYAPVLDGRWMGNDLQQVVVARYPQVEEARRALEAAGADLTQMTGSGGASFGTFAGRRAAQQATAELRRDGWWAEACVTVSQEQHRRTLESRWGGAR